MAREKDNSTFWSQFRFYWRTYAQANEILFHGKSDGNDVNSDEPASKRQWVDCEVDLSNDDDDGKIDGKEAS